MHDVAGRLRQNAAGWPQALRRPDAARRPDRGTWSALEYGCHVRDVFRRYERRLFFMITEDDPLYPNWDQDTIDTFSRYFLHDPVHHLYDVTR